MSSDTLNRFHFRPVEIGTNGGVPCIRWERAGHAASGEPSTVSKVTTYETIAERDAALLATEFRRACECCE